MTRLINFCNSAAPLEVRRSRALHEWFMGPLWRHNPTLFTTRTFCHIRTAPDKWVTWKLKCDNRDAPAIVLPSPNIWRLPVGPHMQIRACRRPRAPSTRVHDCELIWRPPHSTKTRDTSATRILQFWSKIVADWSLQEGVITAVWPHYSFPSHRHQQINIKLFYLCRPSPRSTPHNNTLIRWGLINWPLVRLVSNLI